MRQMIAACVCTDGDVGVRGALLWQLMEDEVEVAYSYGLYSYGS